MIAMLDAGSEFRVRQGYAPACRPHGAGLARFASWSGASGRRYVVTIYDIDACPDIAGAVAFAVRRGADGERRILAAADLGHFPEAALNGAAFAAARRMGATEMHLHLLALSAGARRAMLADIG